MHAINLCPLARLSNLGHVLLATFMLEVSTAPARAQIFITAQLDSQAIYRTDLDGSNPSTLDLETAFGGEYFNPAGIIVSGDQLIWTDFEHDAIFTINLDGSGFRKLVDLDQEIGDRDHGPLGIVQMGNRIFWTSGNQDGIYTAGLDGSNPRLLIDLDSVFGRRSYYANGIAATSTQLFWTNWSTGNEGIYTADLNGGNARKLIAFPRLSAFPRDITATSTHLFWADSGGTAGHGKIYTARVDGSDRRVLVELDAFLGTETQDPRGIAVSGSLIYWTEWHTKGVFAARLDGSNPVRLFTLPVSASFIAVLPPSTPPRPFAITGLRIAPNPPPFQRTWRLTWNSSIAESYRVLLSEDLKTWFPAGGGPWPSEGLETAADITLPENLRRAYFRIERQ